MVMPGCGTVTSPCVTGFSAETRRVTKLSVLFPKRSRIRYIDYGHGMTITILPLIATATPQTLTALLDNSRSPPQHHHSPPHPHSAHHEHLNHHERAEDEDAAVVDISDPKPGDIAISVDTFTNIVSFFFPESNFPGPIFIVQLNSSETEIFWITF